MYICTKCCTICRSILFRFLSLSISSLFYQCSMKDLIFMGECNSVNSHEMEFSREVTKIIPSHPFRFVSAVFPSLNFMKSEFDYFCSVECVTTSCICILALWKDRIRFHWGAWMESKTTFSCTLSFKSAILVRCDIHLYVDIFIYYNRHTYKMCIAE